MPRRTPIIYGVLLAAWVAILAWQIAEHARVKQAARTALVNRARDISSTLGLVVRSQRRFGMVSQERLEPALNELLKTTELKSISLLNAAGAVVVSAGERVSVDPVANAAGAVEHWDAQRLTLLNPIDLGTDEFPEGENARPIIVMPRREAGATNAERRDEFRPRRRRDGTNAVNEPFFPPGPPPPGPPPGNANAPSQRRPRFGRPPWMSEAEFASLIEKRGLHSFVIAMSTDAVRAASANDLWLRGVIALLGAVAAAGLALAWRNVGKSSDLHIRLVRASELNNHLREMNLAAAGLAHETRNPLNLIRGLAQMISKQDGAPAEVRHQAREITDEVDRVTVQLNDFIDYSKPREVRRAPVSLGGVINEVVRALRYDVEDKKIRLTLSGENFRVEADEQMFRQLLFNLALNAIQAVSPGGKVEIVTRADDEETASLEVRDDGPGVPEAHRQEIFKPYFTTTQKGTGLGLAVVQQIVLAHGWEIVCLANNPRRGARFQLSYLRRCAASTE